MRAAVATLTIVLLVVVALAAEPWKVEPQGAGTARVGMQLADVTKALGGTITKDADGTAHCYYLETDRHPLLAFMIKDGVLVRIDVTDAAVFTAAGAQVGDTEVRIKQLYGERVKETKRTDKEGGHYLTVVADDPHYGTRFETDGKVVTAYYAGRFDAIQYNRGCF